MKKLLITLGIVALAFSAQAESPVASNSAMVASESTGPLVWESKEIAVTAQLGAQNESIVFKFTNASDKDVTITNVHASCGCTTPRLEKYTYAPGESGEVTAIFNIGNRQGMQVKQVTVTTDDGAPPSILTLKVDIPELVRFSARALIWRKGEEPAPKTVVANIKQEDAIHLTNVITRDDTFSVELKEVEAGKTYEIIATPSATDKPIARSVTISSDFPATSPQNFTLTLRVL